MRNLTERDAALVSGGDSQTFVFPATGEYAGGLYDEWGNYTDEYDGTWDVSGNYTFDDGSIYYDEYGGYYDIYGGYYDAYGGYADPYGGYYDPYGGYYDVYGGYYDDLGGYYDYYGGYYDAYGGYYDYNGGYYDYYGGYTDWYGGYWDTGGGYSDVSGGFYDGYGNYWDSGNNWYDYYGSTGNCYPAAPPVAGPEPEPAPPEEPDLITPPEAPETEPYAEDIDAGEISYSYFAINYSPTNNDLPNAACGLQGLDLAKAVLADPGTFGLDSEATQAAWAAIGHANFKDNTEIVVPGFTRIDYVVYQEDGADFRALAYKSNTSNVVEIYINGIENIYDPSDVRAINALNQGLDNNPTILGTFSYVTAIAQDSGHGINEETVFRVAGYSMGGGQAQIFGQELHNRGYDVESVSTFGAVPSSGYFTSHFGSPTVDIENYVASNDLVHGLDLTSSGRPGNPHTTPSQGGNPIASHDPLAYLKTEVNDICNTTTSLPRQELAGLVEQWVTTNYGANHGQITVTVTDIPT